MGSVPSDPHPHPYTIDGVFDKRSIHIRLYQLMKGANWKLVNDEGWGIRSACRSVKHDRIHVYSGQNEVHDSELIPSVIEPMVQEYAIGLDIRTR